MKIRKKITCPLELTHDVIKGKWKPIIIWNLKEKQSLSSLEKSINGITQKMLLEHLKELMEFKFVAKTTFPGYPLKVEYYLTDRGKDLRDAIIILQRLGANIKAELEEKTKTYPRKSG
jgi:DNA-binding HxlR family transcriptional regulator